MAEMETWVKRRCGFQASHPGKWIGRRLYIHMTAIHESPINLLNKRWAELESVIDEARRMKFRCVCWDLSPNPQWIRFDEAPDFDSATEPVVGHYMYVYRDGHRTHGKSNSIWHHKWLWVLFNYKGFDRDAAVRWSHEWLSRLYLRRAIENRPSGSRPVWIAQLKRLGLFKRYTELNSHCSRSKL
jgi:hypothetical protein